MSNENAENNQTVQVAPAPVTPVTQTETKPNEAAPVVSPAENTDKKTIAAFVKMRQELRDLKRKQATATPVATPPVTPTETEAQPQPVQKVEAPAPVAKTEVDIETESVKAIESLGADSDVAKVPGAVMDIIDMVDNDPRLTRLHNIDPVLAFREAKALWMSKTGIATPPPVPKPQVVSGGIKPGTDDLASLVAHARTLTPGTRAFSEVAKKINALMK